MPIPDYESCMLPVLRLAADGQEHSLKETIDVLAKQFSLTEEELNEYIPSGQQTVFSNRVSWARTYLKKAGLLVSPRRGVFKITQRGLEVLGKNPEKIDNQYLHQFPEFLAFKSLRSNKEKNESQDILAQSAQRTPHEALESAYERLREELAAELLNIVRSCDPAFFEKIVVELLVKMGYGGSRKEAGRAIGRSYDEGIDGIIKEDHLGLDNIYLQAKKWESTVGRPEIQKFAGALQGQRARKGIFITTSGFSQDALDYVSRIDSKIILIDGPMLASLMIDFGVGVSTVATYNIVKIDSDYFTDN
jgi:restriction system protein